MKHINHDFRSKACVSPLGGLRGSGQKVKIQLFSEHSHVAYQIKGNHKCSSMVANILLVNSLPTPLGLGSKGQNSTFLEHGHAAYQIKKNH